MALTSMMRFGLKTLGAQPVSSRGLGASFSPSLSLNAVPGLSNTSWPTSMTQAPTVATTAPRTSPFQFARKALSSFGLTKELMGQTAVGLGVSAMGQAMAPKVLLPAFSSSPYLQKWQQKTQAGQPQTPLGQLAQTKLTTRLNQMPQVQPEIESRLRRTFQEERDRVTSQFKVLRPGANLAEDSAYRQAMNEVAQRESESIAGVQQQEYERFQNQQAGDIAAALGIDTQTLATLGELANADIQEIMFRTGMGEQRSQEFKSIFSNLGQLLVQQGMLHATR